MENLELEKVRQIKGKVSLTPQDRVFLSRYKSRPKPSDFLDYLIEDPIYMRGDRGFADDQAIICGIGKLNGQVISFIASNKGHDIKENQAFNYGMIKAEGYRKAIRCMKEAEKFHRPLLCIVDTPGAYPGVDAEERGQAHAIAESIYTLTRLKIPVISVISGEGASGGAVSLAVCDYLIMMENAIYSILSPEGFASILYKDAKKADYAKEIMKLEAKDLLAFGIADEVIKENIAETIDDFEENFKRVKEAIEKQLKLLDKREIKDLLKDRKTKFRKVNSLCI
ncbi:acetyl-CoA carboxylase carboxyl transferase subunit alpha [Atopobacter sp. AH10]|uniref:carboxyltransferase subunit alpha n=1 Tax=Atopobacter sp. AH10 TaxID=2315861 RepID=UPI000EF2385F|nr:carboxyltransferase subunit alpha [Atopobacter sp. AH10]RLK63053.1 acetyl-CoA carboxylase carboxyl transferase subunit alpha [Atopobacter sp. AH10]